jgi:hypothetical protein
MVFLISIQITLDCMLILVIHYSISKKILLLNNKIFQDKIIG